MNETAVVQKSSSMKKNIVLINEGSSELESVTQKPVLSSETFSINKFHQALKTKSNETKASSKTNFKPLQNFQPKAVRNQNKSYLKDVDMLTL